MAPVKTQTPNTPAKPETDPFDALATVELVETATDVPDKIKAFVEAGLQRTEANPRKWQQVKLPSESDAKTVLRNARRYAGTKGYSFRVNKAQAPTTAHILYRVTRKVNKETESAK